jgi:hypothetical protein
MTKRIVLTYDDAKARDLEPLCALIAPHYRTPVRKPDAELAKAIFAAFPYVHFDEILIARHLVWNGWQPAKNASLASTGEEIAEIVQREIHGHLNRSNNVA